MGVVGKKTLGRLLSQLVHLCTQGHPGHQVPQFVTSKGEFNHLLPQESPCSACSGVHINVKQSSTAHLVICNMIHNRQKRVFHLCGEDTINCSLEVEENQRLQGQGVYFPTSAPISHTSWGFLRNLLTLLSFSAERKKKLRIALSQLLTGLVVAGGLQSRREGWGGDEGWGSLERMLFKPEMAQEQVHPGTPITQRSPGNGSLKPVWEKSSLSGQKVQFRTDIFSFFSPSSTCSLIHLWQLQSSPAMKGSDPKFYFSHGDAWHLSETYASTGDNDLCSAG